jgi:hypothetical protein
MGTRLLSEHLVKKRYPHLRYIRIHTSGRNTAVIYAWNENLQLPDKEIADLKKFAAGHLSPYVCFKVKAYHHLRADKVPQLSELPQSIEQIAMAGDLDQYSLLAVINNVLSNGNIIFNRYDSFTGTVYFDVCEDAAVSEIEKELIDRYLYEFIPLGSSFAVSYG